MHTQVHLRHHGDAVVLRAVGEFDLATAHLLRDGLAEALATGPSVIVVDLTSGELYDGVALAAVVDAHDTLVADGGVLLIRSANEALGRALRRLGLDRLLAA